MPRFRKITRRVTLALLVLSPPLQSADPPINNAAALSATCYTCHGTDGVSPGSMPSINGKTRDYLLGKLRGFRDGSEENTVMSRIAKGYSDEQMLTIATFLAQTR